MYRKVEGRLERTAGTIEETVTGLDGVVDDIGGDLAVDLPEAEADLGHLGAGVELDRGNHFD